jgi:hypothetical protein
MDGKQNYPVNCMVANLAKPTEDRPGLMSHDDVVTFFHEMGKFSSFLIFPTLPLFISLVSVLGSIFSFIAQILVQYLKRAN